MDPERRESKKPEKTNKGKTERSKTNTEGMKTSTDWLEAIRGPKNNPLKGPDRIVPGSNDDLEMQS